MKFKLTQAQFERGCDTLVEHAQELPVLINFVDGTYCYFGSELATLRLLKAYRDVDRARQGYSAAMETYFFALETDFDGNFDRVSEEQNADTMV